MNSYHVIISPDAKEDLIDLGRYIAYDLNAPDTAVSYLQSIKQEIASLSDAPKRFRLMDEEPWHTRGVRRMNARNFAVFFNIREDKNEVYVQNVIYQKRDLPKVLRSLYPDSDELN